MLRFHDDLNKRQVNEMMDKFEESHLDVLNSVFVHRFKRPANSVEKNL